MKRRLLFAVALIATMTAWAQNIAVVNSSNSTTIYQTLDDAINKATDGSVIYLPGGGFQISGETKINHRVTIMGVSHRGDTDNVDGATIIAGNLNFVESSSGSAVIGVYVTGDINVGTETDSVLNLTVRYCNVGSIQVKHSQSSGMVVNQCYLRRNSNFGQVNVKITNCVTNAIENVNGGTIAYNIVLGGFERHSGYLTYWVGMLGINASVITGNIFQTTIKYDSNSYGVHQQPSNSTGSNNLYANWGDAPINIGVNINELFENWNNGSISSATNFHFKEDYKEYESQIGIYAGTSFNDATSLAPIPRIVSKTVDEQTDASGKLKVTLTVKSK